MSASVDWSAYLSAEQMRNIAVEEFRAVARETARKDFQRILDNAAYELVRMEVDAVFDGGMADHVKAKAVKVIEGLSEFTVFRKPDVWQRDPSKAWVHLQSAMDEAGPQIRARVDEVIAGLSPDLMHDLVADRIGVAIIEKLTAPAATEQTP